LPSQPGDLPRGFFDSSADKDSGEGEGDSRRLLKARIRSRFTVVAALEDGAGLLKYGKSGARRSLMHKFCLIVDVERRPRKFGQMIREAGVLAAVANAVQLSIPDSRRERSA
jgi:hypothetical protein